mgnify:CR=1 FL=1
MKYLLSKCPEFTGAAIVWSILIVVRGRVREIEAEAIGGIQTVSTPFWFEPNLQQLRELMRHVYTHYSEAKEKARLGSIHLRSYWSWQNAAKKIQERLG